MRSLTSFNALAKPDIRTLLVLLVVSFLSAGDVRLKAQVLETKGLLSGVFKGLNEDAEVVVNLVLETVGRELVQERRVALDARRNIFDESCFTEVRRGTGPTAYFLAADSGCRRSSASCMTTRFR